MFGIGSAKSHQKPVENTRPAPVAMKRVLGGLFRRATQTSPTQVKAGEPKPQTTENKPLRNAFAAGNVNAEATLRSLRSGNAAMREGQLLRSLQNSLVYIETEIAKERGRSSPDHERLMGLKTLWAQDNDEIFAMMKGIRDRESKGPNLRSALSPPPQVRTLAEFNQSRGPGALNPVDLDATAKLKNMSVLREKVEFSLASATDGPKKRELEELMADIHKEVHKLTQRALGD